MIGTSLEAVDLSLSIFVKIATRAIVVEICLSPDDRYEDSNTELSIFTGLALEDLDGINPPSCFLLSSKY